MENNQNYRSLPSIDSLLKSPALAGCINDYGRDLVVFSCRAVVNELRTELQKSKKPPAIDRIIEKITGHVRSLVRPRLMPVINATGVILHTNLGRAPLGQSILDAIAPIIRGYSNLELDLATGKRGHRADHLRDLLRYLTGAEDIAIVNNNAAALILILSRFARGKEVIVSRGELIEIGGSFRIPEIMAASGAKMVEVGATNRTRLADYEKAITPKTAIIFKAHTSNYTIRGFTEEVGAQALAECAHSRDLIMVYDIGSGLLRRPQGKMLAGEPDVHQAIGSGADLVCFSADKLLGGPQGGIIAGKQPFIAALAKAPLMRALRVGKITIAALSAACRNYLSDRSLASGNPAFAMMNQTPDTLRARADRLCGLLREKGIFCEVVSDAGQFGGGSLPEAEIPSFAVMLTPPGSSSKAQQAFAEKIFHRLLEQQKPILSILREGRVLFDVLTLQDDDLTTIADSDAFSG
jgi:L-seryl-tRNA(Ser) seleniumtransferase